MTLLRRSATYVTPTVTAGKPVGLAVDAVTEGEFGTFRIEIGNVWDCTFTVTTHELPTVETAGTDYTTFRDSPAILEGVGFAEPYGETVASIVIPAATEFDDLSALFPKYANVDIWRVLPAAESATYGDHSALGYPTDCAPYWHGFLVSVEVSTALAGVTLQAAGALAGEAAYRVHQPVMVEEATAPDIGTAIARQLYPADYGRPLSPWRFYFEADTTGILSRHRGSRGQMVIDYLDEMLTLAQTTTTSWTISRAFSGDYAQARKYYLRERGILASAGVQDNTITVGGYGIDLSLSRGDDDSPNAIYGEGIANDGSRWRNAKYPMLTPAAPTAPDRITGTDYPITLGDVDVDFTAEIVTQLQYQLRASAYPDVEITGIFDADTVTAVEAYQTAMGLTVDGEIGSSAEWADVWDTGATDDELGSGYFQPIALDRRAEYWTYAPNGAVTGTNNTGGTAYDGRLRIERVISFGDKISKARASTYAKRLVNASDDDLWIGEVKLTADQQERSRLLTREGCTITAMEWGGASIDLYVSGVQHAPEDGKFPTTLTVSNQPLDLLDLTTRIERNREAKENPAKSFYSQRMRPTRPFRDAVGWDKESGAGIVQPQSVTGDTWNVIKIVGGQRGTVAAIKARTSASACKFALALFGTEVTAANLNTLIANPLAEETTGYGWWNLSANQDDLETYKFIEAWGEFGEAAGYWPGSESQDPAATLSGKLVDSLSWGFVSDDPPFLWLAVYPDANCTFQATMRIVIEE